MDAARNATTTPHVRRFAVSFHAVERFRERAMATLRERHQLDDATVGDFLDARVARAWDAGRVEDILDMGRPSKVVDLQAPEWGRLYAVLRPNTMPLPAEWAIITVISGSMYDRSSSNGQWRRQPRDATKRPGMEPLASAVPTPAAPESAPPSPPAIPMPAPTAPSTPAPAPEPESWVLTWVDVAVGAVRFERYASKEAVREAITELAQRGCQDFRLHAQVPLEVQVTVHVDVTL